MSETTAHENAAVSRSRLGNAARQAKLAKRPILPISDTLRLRWDGSLNWAVERFFTREARDGGNYTEWRPELYYSDLSATNRRWLRRELGERQEPAAVLIALLDRIDAAETGIESVTERRSIRERLIAEVSA